MDAVCCKNPTYYAASKILHIKIHHIYTTLQSTVYIFNIGLLHRQLCTKVVNLVLCSIILVWFPDDGPLQTETCGNIKCDIKI
jgi:hypothetical protein